MPWSIRGSIKRWPIIAYAQRRILKFYLHDREFVHEVDAGAARGLMYPIVLPEDKGIWTGAYESEFANALAAAVRPGSICYDVGGWRGFFSGVMALAGARRVFVFEPLPENVARIRRLIDLNPNLSIEVVESAIGERTGQSKFFVMPQASMGKLANSPFQPTEKGLEEIVVNIFTLDFRAISSIWI